ncbi:MAG: hypothetical protein M3336_06670, partial [Chloroflexota bacterium]|nr:hypothetical protein [Chloroflexota bacterium]
PNPFAAALPHGLDHLGGSSYLGLLTALTLALGHMDTVAYRLVNAGLGACAAVLVAVIAARVADRRAALLAGLAIALWPTLVLWSATFLRDTLVSFVVLTVWWTITFERRSRLLCVVLLGVGLLFGLRPYVGAAAALGVLAWWSYPLLARFPRAGMAAAGVALIVLPLLSTTRAPEVLDTAAHQLLYRQTTTRLETLGRLYYERDPNAPPDELPLIAGIAVARVDPNSGWLLTGVVRRSLGPGLVEVAYTDDSIRAEQLSDLVPLQSARIPPGQLLATLGPGLFGLLTGAARTTTDSASSAWIADAIAWDVLLVLAVLHIARSRTPVRALLFPGCLVLGTVLALVAVPGAPGNNDRHRAAQTLPLLAVFAAGLLVDSSRRLALVPEAVSTAVSSPTMPAAPAASRTRSLK